MTGIIQQAIRAHIIGGGFNVKTPYILSFYVRKSRGELTTFNFSAKVTPASLSSAGEGMLSIFAGEGQALNKIFTGVVTAVKIRPCFDDPTYVIVDVSGTDVRKFLQGRQFTRRQRTKKSCWVEIVGVNRPGLRGQRLHYGKSSGFPNELYLAFDASLNTSSVENDDKQYDSLNNASTSSEISSREDRKSINVQFAPSEST